MSSRSTARLRRLAAAGGRRRAHRRRADRRGRGVRARAGVGGDDVPPAGEPGAAAPSQPATGGRHVAGNSLGGGIALELARRGDVASATAPSPIGFWNDLERRYSSVTLRLQPLRRAPCGGAAAARRRLADGPGAAPAPLRPPAAPRRRRRAGRPRDAGRCPGFEATLPHCAATASAAASSGATSPSRSAGARATACSSPSRRSAPSRRCRGTARAAARLRPHPMSDDPEGVAALLLAASG